MILAGAACAFREVVLEVRVAAGEPRRHGRAPQPGAAPGRGSCGGSRRSRSGRGARSGDGPRRARRVAAWPGRPAPPRHGSPHVPAPARHAPRRPRAGRSSRVRARPPTGDPAAPRLPRYSGSGGLSAVPPQPLLHCPGEARPPGARFRRGVRRRVGHRRPCGAVPRCGKARRAPARRRRGREEPRADRVAAAVLVGARGHDSRGRPRLPRPARLARLDRRPGDREACTRRGHAGLAPRRQAGGCRAGRLSRRRRIGQRAGRTREVGAASRSRRRSPARDRRRDHAGEGRAPARTGGRCSACSRRARRSSMRRSTRIAPGDRRPGRAQCGLDGARLLLARPVAIDYHGARLGSLQPARLARTLQIRVHGHRFAISLRPATRSRASCVRASGSGSSARTTLSSSVDGGSRPRRPVAPRARPVDPKQLAAAVTAAAHARARRPDHNSAAGRPDLTTAKARRSASAASSSRSRREMGVVVVEPDPQRPSDGRLHRRDGDPAGRRRSRSTTSSGRAPPSVASSRDRRSSARSCCRRSAAASARPRRRSSTTRSSSGCRSSSARTTTSISRTIRSGATRPSRGAGPTSGSRTT